jgi:hypothetical protein
MADMTTSVSALDLLISDAVLPLLPASALVGEDEGSALGLLRDEKEECFRLE